MRVLRPGSPQNRDAQVQITAVFLTSDPNFVPTALFAQSQAQQGAARAQCNPGPSKPRRRRVSMSFERVRMETISDKFAIVRLRFGFMESPTCPRRW